MQRTIARRSFNNIISSDLSLYNKILGIPDLIAFWPFEETTGTVINNVSTLGSALNGTYSGVDLAQEELQGKLYPVFGTGDFANIYSVGLNTAFDGTVGSLALWVKPTLASLTNGANHFFVRIRVDADNQIQFDKTTTNNQIRVRYEGGNVTETTTFNHTTSTWFHVAATWDINAGASGEVKIYKDGIQRGTTHTGIGTWTGNLNSTECVFGADDTTPTLSWLGAVGLPAIWDRALTASEILYIASQ